MRGDDFRRIALGMDGAFEGAHMGHPDFRAHGRIFATLNAEETVGVVMLTPDQQQTCLREHAGMFSPAPGAWGRAGSTRVHLAAADEDTVGVAVTLAWQNSAARAKTPARARKQVVATRRSTVAKQKPMKRATAKKRVAARKKAARR